MTSFKSFCFSYLSQKYRSKDVPPGFTDWYGLHGNSKYYNYTLNENGVLKHFGNQEQEYLTDVLVSLGYTLSTVVKFNYFLLSPSEPDSKSLFHCKCRRSHSLRLLRRQPPMSHSPLPNGMNHFLVI